MEMVYTRGLIPNSKSDDSDLNSQVAIANELAAWPVLTANANRGQLVAHCSNLLAKWLQVSSSTISEPAGYYVRLLATLPVAPSHALIVEIRKHLAGMITRQDPLLARPRALIEALDTHAEVLGISVGGNAKSSANSPTVMSASNDTKASEIDSLVAAALKRAGFNPGKAGGNGGNGGGNFRQLSEEEKRERRRARFAPPTPAEAQAGVWTAPPPTDAGARAQRHAPVDLESAAAIGSVEQPPPSMPPPPSAVSLELTDRGESALSHATSGMQPDDADSKNGQPLRTVDARDVAMPVLSRDGDVDAPQDFVSINLP